MASHLGIQGLGAGLAASLADLAWGWWLFGAALLLLWCMLTLRHSRHAPSSEERQMYRQRAGLLLVLLALVTPCLLHGPALLKLFASWLER